MIQCFLVTLIRPMQFSQLLKVVVQVLNLYSQPGLIFHLFGFFELCIDQLRTV